MVRSICRANPHIYCCFDNRTKRSHRPISPKRQQLFLGPREEVWDFVTTKSQAQTHFYQYSPFTFPPFITGSCCSLASHKGRRKRSSKIQFQINFGLKPQMCLLKQALTNKSTSCPFLSLRSNVHATPSTMINKKELLDTQNQRDC